MKKTNKNKNYYIIFPSVYNILSFDHKFRKANSKTHELLVV